MSGSAYNPWALQDYFQTIAYTLVYSANMGFEEFFMLSAFFGYLKITAYIRKKKSPTSSLFSLTDYAIIYT